MKESASCFSPDTGNYLEIDIPPPTGENSILDKCFLNTRFPFSSCFCPMEGNLEVGGCYALLQWLYIYGRLLQVQSSLSFSAAFLDAKDVYNYLKRKGSECDFTSRVLS